MSIKLNYNDLVVFFQSVLFKNMALTVFTIVNVRIMPHVIQKAEHAIAWKDGLEYTVTNLVYMLPLVETAVKNVTVKRAI